MDVTRTPHMIYLFILFNFSDDIFVTGIMIMILFQLGAIKQAIWKIELINLFSRFLHTKYIKLKFIAAIGEF